MREILIFLVLLILVVPVSAATIYKWVDEKGVANFTDDYDKIPPSYRENSLFRLCLSLSARFPPRSSAMPWGPRDIHFGLSCWLWHL